MKNKSAIILCAGFGKRMLPLTKKTPKPLIKINGITLLENTINFLVLIGIKNIIINSHYLHKKISQFLKSKKFDVKIKLVIENKEILDTGGGILNASKLLKRRDFIVINPDTFWSKRHVNDFKKLDSFYFRKKKPVMLLESKTKSYDKSFKGDFNINSKQEIKRDQKNKFIFTGAQILNRSIFQGRAIKPFSMNLIWNSLIKKKHLFGIRSQNQFYHLNNLKILKKMRNDLII